MKILKCVHTWRTTCTVCKCTEQRPQWPMVLKRHDFNAWQRCRKQREDRGEWEQSCFSLIFNFQTSQPETETLDWIQLQCFERWNSLLFVSLQCRMCFLCLLNRAQNEFHVCCASLPYAKKKKRKKKVAWDKRSSWGPAGYERGVALTFYTQ